MHINGCINKKARNLSMKSLNNKTLVVALVTELYKTEQFVTGTSKREYICSDSHFRLEQLVTGTYKREYICSDSHFRLGMQLVSSVQADVSE